MRPPIVTIRQKAGAFIADLDPRQAHFDLNPEGEVIRTHQVEHIYGMDEEELDRRVNIRLANFQANQRKHSPLPQRKFSPRPQIKRAA